MATLVAQGLLTLSYDQNELRLSDTHLSNNKQGISDNAESSSRSLQLPSRF